MSKFKISQLVITKVKVSDCGCSWLPVGTIVKVQGSDSEETETSIKSCNNGCELWIDNDKLRVLSASEKATAKSKFENATEYAPAIV